MPQVPQSRRVALIKKLRVDSGRPGLVRPPAVNLGRSAILVPAKPYLSITTVPDEGMGLGTTQSMFGCSGSVGSRTGRYPRLRMRL